MEQNYIGHIVNIKDRTIIDGVVTVDRGRITEIIPMEKDEMPENAPYLLPGLIDSHIHIESTMLQPSAFAKVAVTHGTVAVMADPHEIANVLGVDGIDYMIRDGRRTCFNFFFAAPSCVASSERETSGATLDAKAIALLMRRKDISHLGEMMNFPGVLFRDPDTLAKIKAAVDAGKKVDGHSPGLLGEDLHTYQSYGISTDHECTTLQEALERIYLGMYVQIRQGSAARDFDNLSPLIASHPTQIMFCSDDKHVDELLDDHLEGIVRKSVALGYNIFDILQAACLNPIIHYGLNIGLLRPGDPADFIEVDNLSDFNVNRTVIKGHEVFNKAFGLNLEELSKGPDYEVCGNQLSLSLKDMEPLPNVFEAKPIKEKDLEVKFRRKDRFIRVITAHDGSLLTGKELHNVQDAGSVEKDVLKMMVLSRYSKDARPSVGFIKGFGLKKGAIAISIAHDCHNIISVGAFDKDIVRAVNKLIEIKGGIVCCLDDSLECLELPVAGLMSPCPAEEVAGKFLKLLDMVRQMGSPCHNPFMTLSFMALPVIPSLKLTDKGLFDVKKFDFVPLSLDQDVHIRKATVKDVDLIHELAWQIFPETYKDILTKEQIEYMMDWMYSKENLTRQMQELGHSYFIADASVMDDTKRPVGYISVRKEGERLFHLEKIYVLPQIHATGIGKHLLRHLENYLKTKSPQPFDIELNVNRYNKAQGFYLKHGFQIRRQGDFEIGNGYYMNDYIMGKTIG